jgi:signal transduction histidine kinase
MNLQVRFALLFTSFVALMLLISSATIFFLDEGYRKQDYFNKIAFEGNEVYQLFTELNKNGQQRSSNLLRSKHYFELNGEQLFIIDSAGNTIFSLPDNLHQKNPVFPKEVALKKLEHFYTDKNAIQHAILYKPESKTFIYISGYDNNGYLKLNNLKIILVFVFLGTFFITGVVSFLFVKQAIKPIVLLSVQMSKTNEMNLSERIVVSHSKDELNTIAQNFNAMLERLRNAFEAQKNFVRHASHELRTPLAVMLSQTEAALNRPYDTEGYRAVLQSLKEDQQNMIELTNSLLLISQTDTINYLPQWPYIRVDELLYDVISAAKKMYADIQIDLSFEKIPEDDGELMIKGNESLLRSAFINLIKNAYNYSYDHRVVIVLTPGLFQLKIAIKNQGEQLKSAEIEKMNIPFFRGENATSKKGFGLGIAIIEKIVSLHRGNVFYTPELDDWNVFNIQFPSKGTL